MLDTKLKLHAIEFSSGDMLFDTSMKFLLMLCHSKHSLLPSDHTGNFYSIRKLTFFSVALHSTNSLINVMLFTLRSKWTVRQIVIWMLPLHTTLIENLKSCEPIRYGFYISRT